MIKLILKQVSIVFSSAAVLSAGVAFGATTLQLSPAGEGDSMVAQGTCVTDVSEYPTADADVDYVTADTTCFDEEDGITIYGEFLAIEYDNTLGYYYVDYNGVRWYFVEWDGVVLLTNGVDYVEFALVS